MYVGDRSPDWGARLSAGHVSHQRVNSLTFAAIPVIHLAIPWEELKMQDMKMQDVKIQDLKTQDVVTGQVLCICFKTIKCISYSFFEHIFYQKIIKFNNIIVKVDCY